MTMGITPFQCRMARAALSWSQAHLATHCGVDRRRVHRFEMGARIYDSEAVSRQLRGLLEDAGISFRDDGISYPTEWTNE
jgi:ribosome-binding protein aMBF1 (putative translation factor)